MGELLVYIAGPYRAKDELGIALNIRMAQKMAVRLAQRGICFICPHLNSAHFDGVAPDEFFLRMGLEHLRRCDAVYLLPGWEKSEGTLAEIELAKSRNMPVTDDMDVLESFNTAD